MININGLLWYAITEIEGWENEAENNNKKYKWKKEIENLWYLNFYSEYKF